jgi:hypothetical protein
MRNKYKGRCWVCGETVEVGQGYFLKTGGKWITKHATGTIEELKRCKNSVAYKNYNGKSSSKSKGDIVE